MPGLDQFLSTMNGLNSDSQAAAKSSASLQSALANLKTQSSMPTATAVSAGVPVASPVGSTTPTGGNLDSWISQALNDIGVSDAALHNGVKSLIMSESGGNPNAINRTDSNAQAGHPSQGLMQTIPSTFAAYALPGHGSITNPVDNIIAGARYALKNYGASMLAAGGRHTASGGYLGY